MGMIGTVEKHTRYVGTAEELTDAWAFVMEHLELVGDSPSIEINPKWSSTDDFNKVRFTVTVAGFVEDSNE